MMKFVVAMLVGLMALGGVVHAAHAEETATLTVSGQGQVTAQPDQGYISLGVVSKAETSAQAVADNSKVMNELYASLSELGVKKEEITTTEFSVSQNYKTVRVPVEGRQGSYESQTVPDGFRVVNLVQVTVCNLDDFGKVLDAVVKDGANMVNSISFGSSEAEKNLDKARELAVKDALRKANILTQGLNVGLGKVLNISESSGGVRPRQIYALAEAARADSAPPVSGGSLTFTVNVSVRWELAQ